MLRSVWNMLRYGAEGILLVGVAITGTILIALAVIPMTAAKVIPIAIARWRGK